PILIGCEISSRSTGSLCYGDLPAMSQVKIHAGSGNNPPHMSQPDPPRGTLPVILAAAFPLAAVAIFAPRAVTDVFTVGGYMPHGHCYLWEPRLVALHGISDFLIGVSYLAISLTLAYLVYRARDHIPFQWMVLAFGLFIVACGITHFMEVLTLWRPVYWLAGDVKVLTAMASVGTAVPLPPLLPEVLAPLWAPPGADGARPAAARGAAP